jgi:hypothetical protein
MALLYKNILTGIYFGITIMLCMVSAPIFGQNVCTSNGTGGGAWTSAATWSCTGGATQPDATVNTVNILVGDDVDIVNLFEGFAYFSGVVTVNINGILSFAGGGASLDLPSGSIINVGTGGLIDAGLGFFGPDTEGFILIGGNMVWNPAFDGSGDIPGPGHLDENSTNGVLPISLIAFKAEAADDNVELIWRTATEENNDYFTIERSSNGLDFQEIATIAGAGASVDAKEYIHMDKNPLQGVSYYRLKQTDYDGTNETFKVVAVEVYNTAELIKISQNFNRNELSVFNNLDEENTAYVYDMLGRGGSVGSLKIGENRIDLDQLNGLGGIYVINVVNALGKTLVAQKIVVQ